MAGPVSQPVELHTSAGACQRLVSHRQLQISAFTVIVAAAWAFVLHAAHFLLASIASGVHSHKAAAKAHLVLLKAITPSKIYKYRFQRPASNVPVLHDRLAQQDCNTPISSAGLLLSNDTLQQHRAAALQRKKPLISTLKIRRVGAQGALQDHRCVGAGTATPIPMQLNQHQGRLTVALDLDETLLCTYHVEHRSACDTVQLVPARRTGSTAAGSTHITKCNSTWPFPWSRGSPGSTYIGSYSISTHFPGLSRDLRVAARASAWMHYNPAAPDTKKHRPSSSADSSSSSSTRGGSTQSNSTQQPQVSGQCLLGAHTLAVFLRPGCHEFLAQLSSFAEVVLFTAASPHYGIPLADLLDPSGNLFVGRLFADACVSFAGRRGVKDLQVLGRDVRRVVLVDNCLFSFLAQPSNGLPCLPFHGATEDSQLLGVILPLLRSLAQVDGDIRPLLDNMFRVRQWLASKGYHKQHDAEAAAGAT